MAGGLGLLGSGPCNHSFFIRQEKTASRWNRDQRLEDATLLALKTEPRTMSHGVQVAPKSWDRQGNILL